MSRPSSTEQESRATELCWEPSERELVGAALALGAESAGQVSREERELLKAASAVSPSVLRAVKQSIAQGGDPLGAAFARLRSPAERRPLGATYTPFELVRSMTAWAAGRSPSRVVDPGAGSGRFLSEAARRFPDARLIGIELDPLVALLLRATLASAGCAERAQVVCGDYRDFVLDAGGPTLFLGNPPYVRHHALEPRWKAWLSERASSLGLRASRLAGLHVHFLLATALKARPGDFGVFVTAAEWLDVNYGSCVRELLLGALGAVSVHRLEPSARVFPDADTTAAVTCFEVGRRVESVRFEGVHSLAELGTLTGGASIELPRLEVERRWSMFIRKGKQAPAGLIELGELCRVHRGQVTGANRVWIATPERAAALPSSVLLPSVTRARELFAAGAALSDVSSLRCVIDLPRDLDALSNDERRAVERFLREARALGADRGFIARHRKPWWSVGLRLPAPILATYMARRPPVFVRNLGGARHLNIAHGLYPRGPLEPALLDALAAYLTSSADLADGRTYAGGLTKFEPREMERLLVPTPEALREWAASPLESTASVRPSAARHTAVRSSETEPSSLP